MKSWNLLDIEAPRGTTDPVVLDSQETRAVLIAFNPGQELSDHQVKERAWLVVVDGAVTIDSDEGGGPLDAGPGTLVSFAPNERHGVVRWGGARILLLLAPWPGEGHYRGEEKEL
jgi:quercetin dioxygenase-like cupin family protein